MSSVYTASYVCVQIAPDNTCTAWQQTNIGVITPQLAGIIITYAFVLNLVVFGFRTLRRQL